MEKTQIKIIRGQTAEEIAELTEKTLTSLNGFASTIIQDSKDNSWISFIYYKKLNNVVIESPTEKQIKFLKRNQWTGEIPKTKEEAKQLIKSYIEGQKKENI